ncbi:hypothetical protein P5V30_20330 [Mycobacteroides abscessus subsp. abscessus]|uniref:hypothetical protein n=1 Tax=Mycobacteroides abscessus TaxID=36809 RepID=UPI000929838A|nr:hypothetical protein [Mycobacteroides abscessus]MDO2986880.1 hypothetical protein [Mycobacteroides abscessus subsp. abscessus]MDO3208842.1 hypothetical protein [Mycobacteroides abscessus subsp. massiliense]RIS64294.1 hypothetical protein D2E70_25855 [Mycobacteroides abscessus]SID34481.1 Uncharacterised protein [Mycobacteroides abscessus subsp. abscessus]SIJ95493.1 Uncharacterised protein [Mycobacteroides abscessus subsp. abscessus]
MPSSSKPLHAEPQRALQLITSANTTGGQKAATAANGVASGAPGGGTPLDAVLAAADRAGAAHEAKSAALIAASNTTHSAGSTAAVETVVDQDASSANDYQALSPQIAAANIKIR